MLERRLAVVVVDFPKDCPENKIRCFNYRRRLHAVDRDPGEKKGFEKGEVVVDGTRKNVALYFLKAADSFLKRDSHEKHIDVVVVVVAESKRFLFFSDG